MTRRLRRTDFVVAASALAAFCTTSCSSENREVAHGLKQPVEILRDKWGISHIYAENEHDLFFAQGYSAARDRLFQLEIWRRQATGTMAEIQGTRALRTTWERACSATAAT